MAHRPRRRPGHVTAAAARGHCHVTCPGRPETIKCRRPAAGGRPASRPCGRIALRACPAGRPSSCSVWSRSWSAGGAAAGLPVYPLAGWPAAGYRLAAQYSGLFILKIFCSGCWWRLGITGQRPTSVDSVRHQWTASDISGQRPTSVDIIRHQWTASDISGHHPTSVDIIQHQWTSSDISGHRVFPLDIWTSIMTDTLRPSGSCGAELSRRLGQSPISARSWLSQLSLESSQSHASSGGRSLPAERSHDSAGPGLTRADSALFLSPFLPVSF